jgi:hypothetical protein
MIFAQVTVCLIRVAVILSTHYADYFFHFLHATKVTKKRQQANKRFVFLKGVQEFRRMLGSSHKGEVRRGPIPHLSSLIQFSPPWEGLGEVLSPIHHPIHITSGGSANASTAISLKIL